MIRRANALPQDRYTTISNAWLRDERLSWKARGLLAHLASHSLNWETSLERLSVSGPDGRDAVRSGLNELETYGYLVRVRARNEDGTLAGVDVELVDPWISPTSDNPTQVKPTQVDPTPKKNKLEEDHLQEDQDTLIPPPASGPSDFQVWYGQYPKKVKPLEAERAYKKARKRASVGELLSGLERYKARVIAEGKTDFWMNPSSWLNSGSWMDEAPTPHASAPDAGRWDAGRLYG